jgi:hypothetical protein
MGDKYQDHWERRKARWEARRAKWEARQAHDEARRARHDARHTDWEGSRAHDGQVAKKASPAVGLASLGGILILIGLFSALTSGGAAAFATIPLCLAPGAVLLVIGLLVRAHGPKATEAPGQAATEAPQEVFQATARREEAAQTPQPPPQQAPKASPDAPRAAVAPQPRFSEAKQDPSYYRQRATGYRRRIQSIIKNRRPGPLADVMSSVVSNLQRWEERVGQLADRLALFEGDAIIQRDLKEVPADIARLRGQIDVETDPEMRNQMERTMSGYDSQQKLLDTLVRLMRTTRLQLDDTLVAMGTIYSQVQVLDAMDIDSAKTTRIAEEIDEQVKRLNDLLSVLGDAYHRPDQSDELAEAARRRRLEGGKAAGQ